MFVERLFHNVSESQHKLRVMQWNILCNAFAFGSFDRVPNEYLLWEYRLPLIVKHISDVDADIVCLEEVDMFESILSSLGHLYHGHCVMK